MATDSIMGLFQSPEQYQQQRQAIQQAQAMEMAKLSPFQQGQANIQMGMNRFADVGAGLLGIQDPQLQMQTQARQIMQQVNQNDPKSLMQAAQAFNDAGDVQRARALATAAQEMEFKQSQITKNLREGRAAGTKLNEVGVAEGTREPVYSYMTPDGQGGTKVSQVVFKNVNGQQQMVPFTGGVDRTTAKTDVRVDAKGSAAGAVEIAKLDAKRLAEAQLASDKAVEASQILSQLDITPQGISGAAADSRLAALRVFDSVGLTSSTDQKALENADKFNSLTGERTLSFIKQLGTNPTDTDREFAKTIGPSIQKGEKTNKDLVAYLRKRAQETVGSAKAMETHFYKNEYSLKGYESPFIKNVETPVLTNMSADDLARAAGGKIVNGKFVKN